MITYSISPQRLLPGESELYTVAPDERNDALHDILLCCELLHSAHRADMRIPYMRLSAEQVDLSDCYIACRGEDIPVLHFSVSADPSTVIGGNITRENGVITGYTLALTRSDFTVLITGHESEGSLRLDGSRLTQNRRSVKIKKNGVFSAYSAERTRSVINGIAFGAIALSAVFFAFCIGRVSSERERMPLSDVISETEQMLPVRSALPAFSEVFETSDTAYTEETAAYVIPEISRDIPDTDEQTADAAVFHSNEVTEAATAAPQVTEYVTESETSAEREPETQPVIVLSEITYAVSEQTSMPSRSAVTVPDSGFTVTGFSGSFTVGEMAALEITGQPNTVYNLTVYYSSGKSSANGLGNTTSDSEGRASWSWRIGGRTKPGIYRLVISCGDISEELQFSVKEKNNQ